MRTRVKFALLACLAVASVPAATAQPKHYDVPKACQDACTPALAKRLGVLSTAIDVCRVGEQTKCKQKVRVVTAHDGSCTASFEYCVLCVVSKEGGKTFYPTIEWKLSGSAHRFHDSNGVSIPGASVPASGAIAARTHFAKPTWKDNGKTFTWDTGPDPSGSLSDHRPFVKKRSDGKDCGNADPVIINNEN